MMEDTYFPDPAHADEIEQACIEIEQCLNSRDAKPLVPARKAVDRYPTDPMILQTAAFAALVEGQPDEALSYIKRLKKRYVPNPVDYLCSAVALAMKGSWPMAQAIYNEQIRSVTNACRLAPHTVDRHWVRRWMNRINDSAAINSPVKKAKLKKAGKKKGASLPEAINDSNPADKPDLVVVEPASCPLPRPQVEIQVRFDPPKFSDYDRLEVGSQTSWEDSRLRADLIGISLQKGFDELMCLTHLRNVEQHWYQVETVRKVLKQFRGRVLLADEVGLGKTIEAGMILHEYILRGMVKSALILVPSSLVGQWSEEMQAKFGLDFASTHDPGLHSAPERFWRQPRIIASIATAKRQSHREIILKRDFDMVIVDEAHHLKNRTTQNWKLVDSLRKRFLLLLSATPIQNNMIELYNILTLLKPGIFKTEKEFRKIYMVHGKPRVPANRAMLQDLMREVMIRNTRSLVDVRLPPRHALTRTVDGTEDEKSCYEEMDRLIRVMHETGEAAHHRMALHHLVEAAGSSPNAAARAIDRFVARHASPEWSSLRDRYAAIQRGAKTMALVALLRENPSEKKIIFIRLLDTLDAIDTCLREEGLRFARFDGSMSGVEKDAAIEAFRTEVPILLTSESGGEGRNLQFCNTLINYDLPWNPQVIEQRIGRIHRIGQERDVFVFNLVLRGSIEERILRILDEKINMFELVVGEIQAILGAMDEAQEFAGMVLAAWIQSTGEHREEAFETLGNRLLEAKVDYDKVKALDEELFGDALEVV